MEIVILGIVWISLAMMVGALAEHWNRSGLAWGLAALILTPILTLAYLLVAGNAHPRCPACLGHTFSGASTCRNCGQEITVPQTRPRETV
ncbi:MAG: hypothetical protein JJU24_08515 [Natronohydrobacter sp.]|nr:hypothetical protein [Natronohydrobacter sp.]